MNIVKNFLSAHWTLRLRLGAVGACEVIYALQLRSLKLANNFSFTTQPGNSDSVTTINTYT